MKKILLIQLMCIISLFGLYNKSISLPNGYAQSTFTNSITEEFCSDSNYVIALLLYDEIDKAIQNYYGKPTQFALYDSKVTDISQINNEFSYNVTIEVPTFSGPHNPPYGLEVLTFIISPGAIILENYEHISITN